MQPRPRFGTRPLDRLRSRLGIFRGGVGEQFETVNDAPEPADAGPIEHACSRHKGRVVHKWHHYLPLYDRYLAPYRERAAPVRMLEIGVAEGGSLELWRGYFGPQATIFGVDLNPACAAFDGEHAQVRIGSQADEKFLAGVIREMGGVDIVLDDGSHVAAHVRASFDALFPLLAEDGLYIVEDTHGAYSGQSRRQLPRGARDGGAPPNRAALHPSLHPHGAELAPPRRELRVGRIHVHNSIYFIEKRYVGKRPDRAPAGGPGLAGKA